MPMVMTVVVVSMSVVAVVVVDMPVLAAMVVLVVMDMPVKRKRAVGSGPEKRAIGRRGRDDHGDPSQQT